MYVCAEIYKNNCVEWQEVNSTQLNFGLTQEEGIYLGAQFFLLALLAWSGGLLIKFVLKHI